MLSGTILKGMDEMKTESQKGVLKAKWGIILVIIMALGIIAKIAMGSALKAKEPENFVELKAKGTELNAKTSVNTEDITFTLKSSENRLIKIPENEAFKIAAINGKAEVVLDAPENFKEEDLLKKIQEVSKEEEKESSSENENTKEKSSTVSSKEPEKEQEKEEDEDWEAGLTEVNYSGKSPEEIISTTSSLFLEKNKKEKTNTTYITLIANKPIKIIARHQKLGVKVPLEITDVASKEKQTLFIFGVPDYYHEEEKSAKTNEKPAKEKAEKLEAEKNKEPEVDYSGFRGKESPIKIVQAGVYSDKIIDGTRNFDFDDNPGHDSAPDNLIVRSFDKVIYNVQFATQGTDSENPLTNIKYQIESTLKNSTDVIDGQNIQLTGFVYGTSEGKNSFYNQPGIIQTANGQVELPVQVNVYGAPNRYEVKPDIRVRLISGQDKDGKTVPLDIVTDNLVETTVRVSSKVSFTAEAGTDQDLRVQYQNVDSSANNSAYAQVFSVSLAITPLKDGSVRGSGDYRGVAFPKGTIKGQFTNRVYFSDNQTGATKELATDGRDQEYPQVINYGLLTEHDTTTVGFEKTAEFAGKAIKPQSAEYKAPNAVYSKPGTRNSAVDSGKFTLKNTPYKTIFDFSFENPAAYKFPSRYIDGTTPTPPDKLFFATGFATLKLSYDYINGKGASLQNVFNLNSVTYDDPLEGTTKIYPGVKVETIIDNLPGGAIMAYTPWNGNDGKNIGSGFANVPSGEAKIPIGSDLEVPTRVNANSLQTKYVEAITAWNGGTVELTRPLPKEGENDAFEIEELTYGVLKGGGKFPGLDTVFDTKKNKFDWYDSLGEAKKHGVVTAVYRKAKKTSIDKHVTLSNKLYFKGVSTAVGERDESGNPNVVYTLARMIDDKGKILVSYPFNGMGNFKPTTYNSNGDVAILQNPVSTYGDTLYFLPMQTTIKLTLYADKEHENNTPFYSYEKQIVDVLSTVAVGNNDDYQLTYVATLPNGIAYVPGTTTKSSSYPEDIPIDEPEIKKNSNGTTTLTWTPVYNITQRVPRWEFKVMAEPSAFQNGNSTFSGQISMSISGQSKQNPSIKDRDSLSSRTSNVTPSFIKASIITADATRKERIIEIGDNDPAAAGKFDEDGVPLHINAIHYNMNATNWSNNNMRNVRLLDVLPYNQDRRYANNIFDSTTAQPSSNFKGTYTLLNVKLVELHSSGAQIYYTTSTEYTATTDPNTVNLNNWTLYQNNSKQEVENVRAVMVVADNMAANERISVDLTVAPKDTPENMRKTIYLHNNASFNSNLNMKVESVPLQTRVDDRVMGGYGWFDDDPDGFWKQGEVKIPNLPFKIYRKSIRFKETNFKVLEENLLGEDLLHLQTDSDGTYKVDALPEGEYKVEFQLGDEYKATLKDPLPFNYNQTFPGSKPEDQTSKINPVAQNGTAITDAYVMDSLANEGIRLFNINAGVIRKGGIEIYKYMEGLISDVNKDYIPDDPRELNPDGSFKDGDFGLPGAKFELWEVVKDPFTQKVLSTQKVDEGTTDENGYLGFKMFPPKNETNEFGDVLKEHTFQLKEVEAPYAYKLMDNTIDGIVAKGGKGARYYVPNTPVEETLLPHTGTNQIMQGILIVAGSLFLMALFFVGVNLFRLDDGWKEGR